MQSITTIATLFSCELAYSVSRSNVSSVNPKCGGRFWCHNAEVLNPELVSTHLSQGLWAEEGINSEGRQIA